MLCFVLLWFPMFSLFSINSSHIVQASSLWLLQSWLLSFDIFKYSFPHLLHFILSCSSCTLQCSFSYNSDENPFSHFLNFKTYCWRCVFACSDNLLCSSNENSQFLQSYFFCLFNSHFSIEFLSPNLQLSSVMRVCILACCSNSSSD